MLINFIKILLKKYHIGRFLKKMCQILNLYTLGWKVMIVI